MALTFVWNKCIKNFLQMRLASENAINLESDQTFFSEIAQPLALAKEKVNFPIFWCDRRSVGPNLASIWNFNVSNCYLPPSGSLRLQYFDLSQQLKSNRMENTQCSIHMLKNIDYFVGAMFKRLCLKTLFTCSFLAAPSFVLSWSLFSSAFIWPFVAENTIVYYSLHCIV